MDLGMEKNSSIETTLVQKNSSTETTLVQEVNIMKSQDLLCVYILEHED